MIWVMKNGGKRRWVFKFIGFGAEELKSFERLDFKKLTLSLSFIGVWSSLLSLPSRTSKTKINRWKRKIIAIVGSACNLIYL